MLPQGLEYLDGKRLPIGYESLSSAPTADPGRLARLTARVRAHSLDRELIAGADPAGSPQLAARAAQLTSARTRAQIAAGLERLVEVAQGPQRRWSAVSPHGPALANAATLRELAALLREDAPLYARGVAILDRLLSDGSGPAYRGSLEQLAGALGEARAAVDGLR